jgi:MoaA/NifB/PqqE/SkfB family radical SAM enzyme
MFKVIRIKNYRKGLATNSSSTHSIIYKNDGDVFNDLNIFGVNYFGRHTENIAASRAAKIKYIYHCIWHDDELVRLMSLYYPEMKEYYPLAKKGYESFEKGEYEEFGEHCRGSIGFNKDIVFSVDYLRHIIDSEDLVIVGGSDEADFVYDTTEGHQLAPMGCDIYDWDNVAKDKNVPIKNGNYYVAYGDSWQEEKFKYAGGGRIRFMTEDGEPVPQYPELIDLRITNQCEHGCPFCFMDSKANQKHADINELEMFVNNLKIMTEFSIGGGNVLLYPELEKLLQFIKRRGHIVNVTINVKDCEKVMTDKKIRSIFIKYVDGIGVSVFCLDDVKTFCQFEEFFDNAMKSIRKNDDYIGDSNFKYMTMHIVPEYLGFEKTMEIMDYVRKERRLSRILLLGYKETGRGANCEHTKFTNEHLDKIFKDIYTISVDTSFANTYADYIKSHFSTKYTLTENEGEYSMYVDGITMNAYKSSHETDKPYYVGFDYGKPWDQRRERLNYEEAFANIRKDCGFEPYGNKRYWD